MAAANCPPTASPRLFRSTLALRARDGFTKKDKNIPHRLMRLDADNTSYGSEL